MSANLLDCFLVRSNGHGEKATYARHSYQLGELVYLIRGEATTERTRRTIQIGSGQHVLDSHAEFINHSFTPNVEVRGRQMIAIMEISEGDELTFNYLKTESAIAAPFVCHETGQRVDSECCRDAVERG
jgi:hypothetical protein